jgi:ATP-dependent Lhr-like helicase
MGQRGLHVVEQKGAKGFEVRIFSFSGSRFNRLLALLLQHRLGGKAQVRYNDFIVRVIHAGKEGAGQRVMSALQEIQKMNTDEIGTALPLPQPDGWKFARALPPSLMYELSLSDHYHVEEFLEIMSNAPLFIRKISKPNNQGPEF